MNGGIISENLSLISILIFISTLGEFSFASQYTSEQKTDLADKVFRELTLSSFLDYLPHREANNIRCLEKSLSVQSAVKFTLKKSPLSVELMDGSYAYLDQEKVQNNFSRIKNHKDFKITFGLSRIDNLFTLWQNESLDAAANLSEPEYLKIMTEILNEKLVKFFKEQRKKYLFSICK